MGEQVKNKLFTYRGATSRKQASLLYLLFIEAFVLIIFFIFSWGFSPLFQGIQFLKEPLVLSLPFGILGILLHISFPLTETLLGVILTVLVANILAGYSFLITIVAGVSLVVGCVAGKGVEKKGKLIPHALLSTLFQAVVASLAWFFFKGDAFLGTVLLVSLYSTIPGIGILFLTLYLGEEIFRIASPFKLMELCSESSPLLKTLREKAPGTFYHSINTAFIAEEGAVALGVDHLLCRVGGLYHDIGKIWKPEYYSENQFDVENVHEHVSRDISRFIIISHIDEGVKLARKHKLGREIEEIMRSHHGDAPLYYFDEKGEKKRERYPGPVPGTEEQAIVMLADAAEAVARSLREVTIEELGRVVQYVVSRAIKDGQLKGVRFGEERRASLEESLFRSLKVIYHNRIFYPSKGGFGAQARDDAPLFEKLSEKKEGQDTPGKGDGEGIPDEVKYH